MDFLQFLPLHRSLSLDKSHLKRVFLILSLYSEELVGGRETIRMGTLTNSKVKTCKTPLVRWGERKLQAGELS